MVLFIRSTCTVEVASFLGPLERCDTKVDLSLYFTELNYSILIVL
jgi:hypothetical protein